MSKPASAVTVTEPWLPLPSWTFQPPPPHCKSPATVTVTVSLVWELVMRALEEGMMVVSSTGSPWGTMASRVPPSVWARVRVGLVVKVAASSASSSGMVKEML